MKINPLQTQTVRPLKQAAISPEQRLQDAKEVQKTFRMFVGESFFGQMLKSMRSTQGKPAYFHGGQSEEVFQGQLDQELSKVMTEASADTIADPMFRQQFPRQAEVIENHARQEQSSLADLNRLRRN
jgi:flagellar protein FlgJ